MGEQLNREKWLAEVKKQAVDLSISDHLVKQRISLTQIHMLDLQLVRWMRPFMLHDFAHVAQQMSQSVSDLFNIQSMVLSEKTKEDLTLMYVTQARSVFSGIIDQHFLTICRDQAAFFFDHHLNLTNQAALNHLYQRRLMDGIIKAVNYSEQALTISDALGKVLNLNYQLVMDSYQQMKKAYEIQKAEEIRFKAFHDVLTGLPNNLVAEETIVDLIKTCQISKQSFSLLKINIDRLKIINEIFGRSIGNELLISLSGRVNQTLNGMNAELFRISSDEFMIICKSCLNKRGLIHIAEKLVHTTEKPHTIEGKEIYATFSIGISEYPYDGTSSVQILASAEAALREAKKSNKESYFFYNNELHQQLIMKVSTENELQTALYNHQFVLFYQPQVNACNGTLIGVEALIRWKHPKRGIVPPSGFISVAEETGMIREIGWWVLKEACQRMKSWQDRGAPRVPVSVNLSFNQFHDDSLVKRVCHALEVSGLCPEYLELEITESTMAEDLERSIKILNEIRALGVGVSLDDFGTGYSSLSYLKSLPINQLKIDRSFVLDIAKSNRDQAIVTAIVSMAEQLWIDVIVEGIETKEQLLAIESCRCRAIQGYYYSRPLAEEDFSEKYLA
ncbi:bifunctional diguanylate cyclase/phosphodiesterase [Sporolactobacillus sp. STCC-11]|uniref:putative bifunctional diguanylate cyclase/phosphodiesterase n=1 Tax=Sporolactobacillus caesalpiniae TaxID=3230362 RepID=UPI00339A28F5